MHSIRRATPSVVLLAALVGCAPASTHLARLHADDGQVIDAGISHHGEDNGRFWVQLPDGEYLQGTFVTFGTQEASISLLHTPWGPITTVSMTQAGPEVSRFTADGNRGTSIQCIGFPKGPRGVGGCRDSTGKSYRLTY